MLNYSIEKKIQIYDSIIKAIFWGNMVGDMPRGWAELKGHIIAQT